MNAPRLHAVSPIFQVEVLERGIDFYTRMLGFKLAWTWGTPPDRASLRRDAVEITLETRHVGEAARASHVYLQVEKIDEYYAAIIAAGARAKVPLADRAYGMRDCRVIDPDANELSIGESISRDRP
ncbi:MAG: glyoxalase superfamily protein [Pseudomonadota bacterium]